MIVVALCCHARRKMRVCNLMRKTYNGWMDVAWASFWEKAGAGNLAFFRLKWLPPAMEVTSCVRRVRLRSNGVRSVPPQFCMSCGSPTNSGENCKFHHLSLAFKYGKGEELWFCMVLQQNHWALRPGTPLVSPVRPVFVAKR